VIEYEVTRDFSAFMSFLSLQVIVKKSLRSIFAGSFRAANEHLKFSQIRQAREEPALFVSGYRGATL
jgi:hypothetical protein